LADTPQRRRDQLGGAISLWVVLMVPVAAFAAVVAMAGPQRMAAESSMNEAADDLATLAVAIRDGRNGQGQGNGKIDGFLPNCPEIGPIPDLDQSEQNDQKENLKKVCDLLLGGDGKSGGYLRRDLGNLGINTDSWEGFYSDSITLERKDDPDTSEDESETEDEAPSCAISENRMTRNSVYVALAADWEDGGWAAAQAWPNGVRVGEELVARLNQSGSKTETTPECDGQLEPPPTSQPSRTFFSE
jgi:hypothetical protein